MAEKVGIDRSFLADVERGKRNVSILNLELIDGEGAEGFVGATVFAALKKVILQ